MPKSIFLFNGGQYDQTRDEGRIRHRPLTNIESEMVFVDPALLSETGTGFGTDFSMQKYFNHFCNVEVGDEIFIGLIPDQTLIAALWAKSYNAFAGFTVDFDLVSAKAVYAAYLAAGENPAGVLGVATYPGVTALAYDFTDGEINNTTNAVLLGEGNNEPYTNYRNLNSHKTSVFNPLVAFDGSDALYIRMTVTALGAFSGLDVNACCNSCDDVLLPEFKAGVIMHTTCAGKQVLRDPCNCAKPLCKDCD